MKTLTVSITWATTIQLKCKIGIAIQLNPRHTFRINPQFGNLWGRLYDFMSQRITTVI